MQRGDTFFESSWSLDRPTSVVLVQQTHPAASPPPALHAHASRVVAAIVRLPASHADVEDCASEAVRRAFEATDRPTVDGRLSAYVAGIARHVALDWIRSKKRERARFADDAEAASRVADRGTSPSERMSLNQRYESLTRALERLPQSQRQAVLLFHQESLDYRAIGERLGVPVGTVATWIARGRAELVSQIEREERYGQ